MVDKAFAFVSKTIDEHGIAFTVKRTGETVKGAKGINDKDGEVFAFHVGADIRLNDVLQNSVGEELYAVKVGTEYIAGEPCYYGVKLTNAQSEASATFTIHNAYNSIIGTQTNAVLNSHDNLQEIKNKVDTDTSEDKEALQQIVTLLEDIVNGKEQPRAGMLSKFSALFERHSWLTGSVASVLLDLLLH